MRRTIIMLFLVLEIAGCKVATITLADMKKIETESFARDPGLSRYAYPWYYVGSDNEFDYVLHSGVIGDRDLYRVRRGELSLEKRFERTKDESLWIAITTNGKALPQNNINSDDP
ncbi:MAG: hypothetical protein WA081_11145 [Desulfosalsimonadaceae bacterium]